MIRRTVLTLFLSSLVAAVPLSWAAAETRDGLVSVETSRFDQLEVKRDADLASYRAVMIDPVRVQFQREWQKRMNNTRDVAHRIDEAEVQRIADDFSASAGSILAETFRARGYSVVNAPGPGVLRLAPTISELYVNSPDIMLPGKIRSFVRDAGDATLVLEARDAASGTVLARTVYRATAQINGRLNRTDDATNQFWFDSLFRRWAGANAQEFSSGGKVAVTH